MVAMQSLYHWRLVELTPYPTHQLSELPIMCPDVTHWRLHQGQCLACGKRRELPEAKAKPGIGRERMVRLGSHICRESLEPYLLH